MPAQSNRARLYAWLGLLAVTRVAADTGDDFSNNLFSDLSPWVSWKSMFMSESMGWADNIILAMAPLGIITIIISAIRVGGPSWLKAIVGRARENLSAAEVELMSSTSEEVCELWNGRGLVRCMGSAPVVEFICLPPKDKLGAKAPVTERKRSSTKSEMLHVETTEMDKVLYEVGNTSADDHSSTARAGQRKTDVESANSPQPSQRLQISSEIIKNSPQRFFITRNLDHGSPNVSLNIHGSSRQSELVLAAACGTVLQMGVLVYAGLATYYPSLRFPKDDEPVASYAYPCTTIGTLLLVLGIAVCAHVVDSSTKERQFKTKDERKIRVVWLQQQKTVSDQIFRSCAIYSKDPQQSIKSSRRYERPKDRITLGKLFREISARIYTDNHHEVGNETYKQEPPNLWVRLVHPFQGNQDYETQLENYHLVLGIKTVLGAAVTLIGFVLQFVGLRGMHWSISIAQLGAVLVMVMFKAWVRRRLAVPPKIQELAPGFELDWLAKTLGNDRYADFEHWGGKDRQKDDHYDWIILGDMETKLQDVRKQYGPRRKDEDEDTDTVKSHPVQSYAQAILVTRKELGSLANWRGCAYDEAVCLAKAIEVIMDTLLNRAGSAESWEWQLSVQCDGSKQIGLQLRRDENGWKVEIDEIDAALSLWLSSTKLESGEHLEAAETHIENQTQAAHRNASQSSESEGMAKSRSFRGKRSLGLFTSHLEQDLAWWVPRDLLRTFKLNKKDDRLLNISSSRASRPGSQNGSQQAQGPLDGEASSHQVHDSFGEEDIAQNDEVMAIDFHGTQKMMCAQSLFELFMRAVAERVENPVEGGVDELLPESTVGGGDWKKFQLRNNTLSRMVQDVHQTGLGSLGEVYTSIVTPLSRRKKLPQIDRVVEWVREHAEKHARLEDWQRTGDCLEWLSKVAETPSTIARTEGTLLDHLRRVTRAKTFQEQQSIEPEQNSEEGQGVAQRNSPVKSLADLQETLQLSLEAIRRRQHELADPYSANLPLVFDHLYDFVDWAKLLPIELVENNNLFEGRNGRRGYAKAFNVTKWHYYCLTGYRNPVFLEAAPEGHGNPVLFEAAPEGHANAKDILDRTPAHYQAATGEYWIDQLKNEGADLNVQDLLGWTPLHYACWARQGVELEQLVQAGVGLDHQARDGATPLHCAVSADFADGVLQLVEAGATVDVRDFQGNLPIHLAAYNGKSGIVSILLDSGSRNLRDRFGRTALHQAALAGKKDVIETLLANGLGGKDLEAGDRLGQTPLSLATRTGHWDCVKVLLGTGADINATDREHRTPLYWAVISGQADLIPGLVDEGAHIESGIMGGRTPLQAAAISGHPKCVHALLNKGAAINSSDQSGKTPLYFAASSGQADSPGHVGCVRELLDKKANVRLPNGWDGAPLHAAARSGKYKVVEMMLENDSTVVNLQTHHLGETPLMAAAEFGQTDILTLLFKNGADLGQVNNQGHTVLHCASAKDVPESIVTLIGFGADKEATGKEGVTPLMLAAESGSLRAIEQLVASGTDVDRTDAKGRTALMYATGKNRIDAIKQLLDSSADIEHTDAEGRTALMYAADSNQIDAVKQLLDSGADVERTDVDGKTALSFAWNDRMRDLLKSTKQTGMSDT